MPVADPATCRDHSLDWTDYFYRRRGKEILELVTEEIITEHKENADEHLGRHSASLHVVLNYLRTKPILGKEFVYVEEPYRRYRLGLITARGTPADIALEPVFSSEIDAMHALFLMRLEKLRLLVAGGK